MFSPLRRGFSCDGGAISMFNQTIGVSMNVRRTDLKITSYGILR